MIRYSGSKQNKNSNFDCEKYFHVYWIDEDTGHDMNAVVDALTEEGAQQIVEQYETANEDGFQIIPMSSDDVEQLDLDHDDYCEIEETGYVIYDSGT